MNTSSPSPEIERAVPLSEAPPVQTKQLYPSYIRAIAACAVVQMHAIGGYLYWYNPDTPNDIKFITADIYYGHLRWATPFFIMLSGALLLRPGKEQALWPFLKKRLQRVLIPFAFWGTIYFLYLYRGDFYYGPLPTWGQMAETVLYKDIYFHLWFIPMIAGLYLVTPVLQVFTRHATRQQVAYFLALIFFFNACHLFVPGIFIVKHFSWFGYIGYYLLGYYIAAFPIAAKWKRVLYPIALAMPLLSAFVTWWMTVKTGAYHEKAFVYASPNILLMTGALFLFLRDFDWDAFANRYPRIHQAAMYVAGVSYGVYFVHPILLDVLKNGYFFGAHINPHTFFNYPVHIAFGGILTAIVAIVLSVGTITLLGKSATLKKWLM